MQCDRMRRSAGIVALATWLAGPAWAQQQAVGPVTRYRNMTLIELAACAEAFRRVRFSGTAVSLHEPRSDYRECIQGVKAASRARFEEALAAVRNREARERLRKYDLAFMQALDGIESEPDESREGYEIRQDGLMHLLTHAWTRFELAE